MELKSRDFTLIGFGFMISGFMESSELVALKIVWFAIAALLFSAALYKRKN